MARHMQACLVLRQFEYILNVTEHINENYLRVKEKFLRAIDYVENINVGNQQLVIPHPGIKGIVKASLTPDQLQRK